MFFVCFLSRIRSFYSTYKYLKSGEGLFGSPIDLGMFLQTKYVKDEGDWPDIQFNIFRSLLIGTSKRIQIFDEDLWNNYFSPIMHRCGYGFKVSIALLRPKSRFVLLHVN